MAFVRVKQRLMSGFMPFAQLTGEVDDLNLPVFFLGEDFPPKVILKRGGIAAGLVDERLPRH